MVWKFSEGKGEFAFQGMTKATLINPCLTDQPLFDFSYARFLSAEHTELKLRGSWVVKDHDPDAAF